MLFLQWSFDCMWHTKCFDIINPWFVFKHTRTTMIWLRHSLDMTFIHFSYARFFCFFCIMGLWVLLKYNTTHIERIYILFDVFIFKQHCFHVYHSDCFISNSLVFSCLHIWLFYIKQPCFIVFTNLTALYQAALFSRV